MRKYYLTKNTILSKCETRYGNTRTLDIQEEHVKTDAKVLCRCNIHNTSKYVNLRHFLAGDSCGCADCTTILRRTKNKQDYIDKFIKIYGDSYSFDKLNYIDLKSPGVITCKKHGDFELSQIRYAFDHTPCPLCDEENFRIKRNETYLERLNEKYGNQYEWLTTDFGDYYADYVEFICKKHGNVKQTLSVLLNTEDEDGYACQKCKKERSNIRQSYTLEEAINKAKTIENCKYYDFKYVTEWLGVKHKYKFVCTKHGCEFEQTFDSLLNNQANGCKDCIVERLKAQDNLGVEDFIKQARKVHGERFDYSKVEYVNYKTPVCIICDKHGEFWQTPGNHLNGCGCQKCRNSRLETKVRTILENNNIEYIQEKSLRDLTGKMFGDTPQRIDFFIPKHNICIECQGLQHFKPVKFNNKMPDELCIDNYNKCVPLDKFKYESLTEEKYNIVYFTKPEYILKDETGWYNDKIVFFDVEELLNYILQNDSVIKREWYNHPKYILKKNNKVVKKTVWNKETCFEEAKKYNTRGEFSKKSQTAYNYARLNKWLNEYTWFIELHHKWTYEECFNEARKYNSSTEFRNNNERAYCAAKKCGWLKDYYWLIVRRMPSGYWNYGTCFEEAKKYNTRTEFQKGRKSAYNKSLKEKWIDDYTWFMPVKSKK